jgi:hypothetical protein
MTQRENDSIDASAKAKLGEDRSVSERIRTADTVARLVYFILGLVVIATLGIAAMWRGLADNKKRLDEFDRLKRDRDQQWETQKTYNVANDKLLDGMNALTKANRKDLDSVIVRVDKLEPTVNYLESLRRFGISNKEDFVREHGYPAPSNPATESLGSPTPHR